MLNYRRLYHFRVATKEGGFARAEEIFHLGQSIPDEVREAASGKVARLAVGLSDGISKLAAHALPPVFAARGLGVFPGSITRWRCRSSPQRAPEQLRSCHLWCAGERASCCCFFLPRAPMAASHRQDHGVPVGQVTIGARGGDRQPKHLEPIDMPAQVSSAGLQIST